MPGASNVTRDRQLNWMRGTAYPAPPANWYVGLFTSATGPAAEGTASALPRVAIAATAAAWNAPSGTTPRTISNIAVVTTAAATVAETVTHWVLFDALTAGNRICDGILDTARTINVGQSASFAAGTLKAQMS